MTIPSSLHLIAGSIKKTRYLWSLCTNTGLAHDNVIGNQMDMMYLIVQGLVEVEMWSSGYFINVPF